MEPEESVVSVYTTHPTTSGTNPPLDVYHQIANNIAERITSPIYRFLGIANHTQEKTTKKPWDKIEILDDPDEATKPDLKPLDNDISQRDVEEITSEAKKSNKPEKFTLFSSYLPVKNETNDAEGIDDDLLSLDDVEEVEKPREGPIIYILEFFGSIFQLLLGGFYNLFRPSSS
ncbi:uncharacterized protein LOC115448434 isoform X2 [Manduca sexta]|uniref:Uncharacterized protein n=2 Tax=Manduca sexta TaxID=7130 RepID=A0A921ZHI2_MANSE|nr:uncharacterized protein LOC115448434 isoform X2 [Manduca sexta]KAG6457845.1 hypothetical protein O3G_MSEX010522 [Manduca sexta]KAG6457846.1 hypothetical protein O3G_MSEX010522 [Manduca sexta]KAG6457847.1 hypothetical protein O3G_MSEX010522 [Manduca sexta]